jgi:hypothetical protein
MRESRWYAASQNLQGCSDGDASKDDGKWQSLGKPRAPAAKPADASMCCVSAATVSARREGLRGRPPSIEASRVREMKALGMRPSDIAKALKIDRASV